MKRWFIADTHFGDAKILRYENRPFKSVEEMDFEMVRRWNQIVAADDEVYVVGDFSAYPLEKTGKICQSLLGRKILVMGNHDIETKEAYEACGFFMAIPYPIILDGFWMLSHEPMYINKNMPYANIFGHVHGSDMYKDYSQQSFCVSVERIDYRPVDFEDIKQKIKQKIEK